MKLSEQLTARGFVHQFSGDSLENILNKEPRTFYLGVDPTATSLTIGNLAAYMLARHLVDAGFTPILLIGGGTGMIGDPGGKSKERNLLSKNKLEKNTASIRKQVKNILGTEDVKVVNNAQWLSQLKLINFLRNVGKHFTINSMIKKEIVSKRLADEKNFISFTEFSYELLQAYDFAHLNKTYNCTLQIAGADQWTNILAGIEYIRKTRNKIVHGITNPIIVNPVTGQKFGKSEDGALWLDPKMTTPYRLYQYFLNVEDEVVGDLLKIYTLLSLEKIEDIIKGISHNAKQRIAQRTLAREVTTFVHGEKAAQTVEAVSDILFKNKNQTTFTQEQLKILKKEIPTALRASRKNISKLILKVGLAHSKKEIHELIKRNSVYLGNEKISDPWMKVSLSEPQLLRVGKKKVALLLP